MAGGCDGNEPQRAYYSQLYKFMPMETMILTLGCGKFRIFDQVSEVFQTSPRAEYQPALGTIRVSQYGHLIALLII